MIEACQIRTEMYGLDHTGEALGQFISNSRSPYERVAPPRSIYTVNV